jgi:hypothetical protein
VGDADAFPEQKCGSLVHRQDVELTVYWCNSIVTCAAV